MHLMRLGSVMVLLTILVGCQSNAPREQQAPVAPPATPDTLAGVRLMFHATHPNAMIGMVLSVRTEDKLAAVGDLPLDKFRNGQAVVFIDSNANPIADGTVVNITGGVLVASYSITQSNQRAPQAGDLMVRFE